MKNTLLYNHVRFAVTNRCTNNCSFCYRQYLNKNIEPLDMSKEVAYQTIQFCYTQLPINSDFFMIPWGGEPLLRIDLLKQIMVEFPQVKFMSNTNGVLVNEELYKWFITEGQNFTLSYSLADAYETYGGIREKIKSQPWMSKLAKERELSLNLTVVNYKNLYDDYIYLHEQGFTRIAVQPMLGYDFKEEDLNLYMQNLLNILIFEKTHHHNYVRITSINPTKSDNRNFVEKSKVWLKEFNNMILKNTVHSCGSGVIKLFVDTGGNIWQCDGWHINQMNRLGDIYTGIDTAKLKVMREIYNQDVKPFRECQGCEIMEICPGTQCFAFNYRITGDIFTMYPGFCKFQKALVRMYRLYINKYKSGELNVTETIS